MSWRTHEPRVPPVGAGLRCRCPHCGEAPLFEGLLQVRRRCAVCGLDLRAADPGDGPAVFIILILGALVVAAAILLEAALAPPLWVHAAVWPVVIVAGAIALLRPAKALLIALQYRYNAREAGHHDAP